MAETSTTNTSDDAQASASPPADELSEDDLEQKNRLGYSMEDDEREETLTEDEQEEEAEKGHS